MITAFLFTLGYIAAQCPLSGGPAVYEARAIYSAYQPEAIYYDDRGTCASLGIAFMTSRGNDDTYNGGIYLSPNPADEQSVLNFGDVSKMNGKLTICLSNSLGKCLTTSVINPSTGYYTLDTRELPSGVYFVKISQSEGILLETLKLMVVR